MIKKIGIALILIASLFNYNKVKAEEYKVGDLVELINPDGGKSLKFYIVGNNKENNTYNLISEEKIEENTTLKEIPNSNTDSIDYLVKLSEENANEETQTISLKLIEGTDISACDTKNYYKNEDNTKYYFNCPEIYDKYINSISEFAFYKSYNIKVFDYDTNSQTTLSLFEKSDMENYKYMITFFDDNSKIYNEKITNIYFSVILDKDKSNLIKKVENTQINTNTIIENSKQDKQENIQKEENIENPKTSDLIIWIPLFLLIICGIATIVYIEKKYKNEKIM